MEKIGPLEPHFVLWPASPRWGLVGERLAEHIGLLAFLFRQCM
jgi:hypothetical protein